MAGGIQQERRPNGATSPWTPERVEHVKTRWAAGVSARLIAAEIGPPATRSSVVGLVGRLGLLERKTTVRARQAKTPKRGPALEGEDEVVAAGEAADLEITVAQRRTLLELSETTCRWPIGDPQADDFFFCGAKVDGTRYCAVHAERSRERKG